VQPDLTRRELDAETRVRLLLDVSRRVHGTLDLDEVLDRLLDVAADVVPFDAGGIFVLRDGLGGGRTNAAGTLIAGFARRGYDVSPRGRDPMLNDGLGITGHAIRTGEITIVPDVRTDPRYVEGRAASRSEIAVPIVRGGRVVGALNLESDRPAAFACADAEALSFLVEAAGIAIEHAMLHERRILSERLEAQMRLAQEVQARLLPAHPPVVAGHEVAGRCIATLRIGGDWYDTIPMADGSLVLVIADVAGKGVAAALVMAAFRALVRGRLEFGGSLAQIVADVNTALPESLAGIVFVTAFLARLDPATGELAYVNAGHNPPFVVRGAREDAIEWLETGGPLLGVLPDVTFEEGRVRLAPGDLAILYTDGVVESADPARSHFGAERLATVAARLAPLRAADIVHGIVRLTREFSGSVEYDDDFTLVALRRDDHPGESPAAL